MNKKDPNELNKREKSILKFIEKQIALNSYPPSVREIGKAVGLKSTATVHGYLAKLEEKGYIKKESQKGRTLKLLKGGAGENIDEISYMRSWEIIKKARLAAENTDGTKVSNVKLAGGARLVEENTDGGSKVSNVKLAGGARLIK